MTSEITPFRAGSTGKIADGAFLAALLLAVLAMVPAQVFRLYQDDAFPWLMADYAGRLFVLALLFLLPAGRVVFLKEERLQVPFAAALFWIAGLIAVFTLTGVSNLLSYWLPMGRLGAYPRPEGFLYFLDLTFGLALVAYHEEIVYRRLAAAALGPRCRSGAMLILASATLFGLYHWWTGFGNMIAAALFGAAAMLCYRRTGALWPVIVVHFVLNFIAFA